MAQNFDVRPAAEARSRGISPALLQRRIRDIHLYLSMVFAPSLLFFAMTGALQLYDLHEAKPGAAFTPPALFQELGMVHKKQVFALPRRRAAPPPAEGGASAPAAGEPRAAVPAPGGGNEPGWPVAALKLFFLLAAVGLFVSTCLGIWVGLRPGRRRGIAIGLLCAGAVIPALLLAL